MTQAMQELFPSAELRYCLYHFCRSLVMHLRKEGLLPLYAIPEAKELLRCFMALPFAPLEDVIDGYSAICDALTKLVSDGTTPNRFAAPLSSEFPCIPFCQTYSLFARHYVSLRSFGAIFLESRANFDPCRSRDNKRY